MRLVLRLAWRELRGGMRGLGVVIACLALGVAAIAAVSGLRTGTDRALAEDGARLLGGDVVVSGGAQPLPEALAAWFRARGARVSAVVTLRAMLVAPSGARMLVELKAVDRAWPLLGAAAFDRPGWAEGGGVAVDPLALQRLGMRPGEEARIGEARLKVAAALISEPDRMVNASIFGPRVLMRLEDLPATGLLAPGAISEHSLRAVLAPGADAQATTAALRAAFPDTGWRVRDPESGAAVVGQFVDRTALFLTLVGLTSLLVGGIGVANGVEAWVSARARSIAILRCLGAAPGLVFAICLVQVMALAALGVVIGLAAGAVLPALAVWGLGDALPVRPQLGPFAAPLGLAAIYGMLTAACFALRPLGRAMRIPGGALFREGVLPARAAMPRPLRVVQVLLILALVGLTVATTRERGFALGFCAAAAAALGLFRLGAAGMMALLRRLPAPPVPWARLGLANLHRPGAATPLMLVSVGLGLATLAAVALIQGALARQIGEQIPRDAPSFFFLDIQNSQMDEFRRIAEGVPGVTDLREVPSLRARVVSVAGVPAEQVHATPDTQWALRGDRGLTYAREMPAGTRLVAGQWWPPDYAGPPEVSFDANLAKGWGVKIGDVLRLNVLGRDIDFRVTSLRDISWRSLGINFTMMASPGLLERAPHTHIATLRVPPANQARLLAAVTDALPNVTGIRVAEVLAAAGEMLGQLAAATGATGAVTLLSGALVLAGAVAAGQRRRIRDAVILKSLGATRAQIRAAWLVEFGLMGLVAGLLAAAVGSAASWGVVHGVMGLDWSPQFARLALTIGGCVALLLGFGYIGTARALRVRAASWLRNE